VAFVINFILISNFMNENDVIQRFIFENIAVRGEWARLSASYRSIVEQHGYPPLIQHLLGELLVSSCLLTSIVKFKGRLTVQFQGKDKLKMLLAQCDDEYRIRGLAQWQGDIHPEELPKLFSDGVMVITIEPKQSGQRYQGIVEWQGNSISESIEGYFKTSEQLPTRIWIDVTETSATGLLIQVMPRDGSKPQQEDDDWLRLNYLTDTITNKELSTLDAVSLLSRLYAEEEVRIFQPDPIVFSCNCDSRRCENALLILGRKEVEDELKNKQKIVVTCEFCNKEYSFDQVDVARIFSKGDKPPSSTQVH
jgi:molecular chaperone Hsp33